MFRLLGATIAVAAVIAAVVFGGYQAGWWFRADSTNRQAQVNQSSYGFQQSRIDELHQDTTTLAGIGSQIAATTDTTQQAALRAQGHAITASACAAASQVFNAPADLADFIAHNCAVGTVSASSPYSS